MGRRASSAPDTTDEYAQAGARSIDTAFADAKDIMAINRAAEQDARALERDARADKREDRMAQSMSLDDEVKKWEFEKKKTLDTNAALMKIETDKQAIEANKELFKINTADDDANEKLLDWGAKYFRVLDEKTGDPRLIRQFQINQTRAENRQMMKAKAEEARLLREEKEAAAKEKSYGTVTIKDGDRTITKPLGPPEQQAIEDLKVKHDALEKTVNAASGKPQDPATIAELNSIKARLGFAQIDPVTLKVSSSQASPSAPIKIAAAEDFNALPSGAEFIDPQGVRRRKP